MSRRIRITLSIICILACAMVIIHVPKNKKVGIYYKPINAEISSVVYELGQYAYSPLHYNDHIYSSNANIYFDTHISLNDLGKKIGTVYGNNYVKWSTNQKELYKSNVEGTLYSLKGFDSSYLVVIVYEQKINNSIIITPYVRLNDITLNNGRELFKSRFHIENCSSIYGVNSMDKMQGKISGIDISLNNAIYNDFLDSLYHSKFIEPTEEITKSLKNSDYTILTFAYDNKLQIDCHVYKNGYVSYSDGHSLFYIKMDDEKCSKLIELTNK